MKDLIVKHHFDLESNMDEVKTSIAETLKKYDVVVTEDRLSEAKDLMARLNKEKKAFTEKCKGFLSAISAPLDKFKAQQKEIEKMYDDGRAKIADQVAKFEQEKLLAIGVLLTNFRNSQCQAKDINPESVTINDLIQLSAVNTNKNGYSISAKTAEAINLRIQTVENEILRAKLKAEEDAKRDREIAEQARKEAEEEARRREAELLKRAEEEKIAAVENAKKETLESVGQMTAKALGTDTAVGQMVQEVLTPSKTLDEEASEVLTARNDGKKILTVVATFETIVPAAATNEMVANKLRNLLVKAGITSLKNIEVR